MAKKTEGIVATEETLEDVLPGEALPESEDALKEMIARLRGQLREKTAAKRERKPREPREPREKAVKPAVTLESVIARHAESPKAYMVQQFTGLVIERTRADQPLFEAVQAVAQDYSEIVLSLLGTDEAPKTIAQIHDAVNAWMTINRPHAADVNKSHGRKRSAETPAEEAAEEAVEA